MLASTLGKGDCGEGAAVAVCWPERTCSPSGTRTWWLGPLGPSWGHSHAPAQRQLSAILAAFTGEGHKLCSANLHPVILMVKEPADRQHSTPHSTAFPGTAQHAVMGATSSHITDIFPTRVLCMLLHKHLPAASVLSRSCWVLHAASCLCSPCQLAAVAFSPAPPQHTHSLAGRAHHPPQCS